MYSMSECVSDCVQNVSVFVHSDSLSDCNSIMQQYITPHNYVVVYWIVFISCGVLHCVEYHLVLYCVALCCSVLQCAVVWCGVLHCVECHIVLCCVVLCCSTAIIGCPC
jgi:hypothetical protein